MNKLAIKKNQITFIIGTTASSKTIILKKIAKNDNLLYIEKISENNLNIDPLFIKQFGIKNIITKKLKSKEELALLTIISKLLNKEIIIDNLFSYLNLKNKTKLINYFKKNKYTIIIISKNIEDILFSDNIILINNNEILINCKKEEIYKEEKILKRLGLNLPFIINLSIQLNIYDLIKKIYYKDEEMIGDLWK